jgi:site-specific DNA-cytosine methylase
MMGEKWEKVLSKAIGVNPIMINSSLVSAQNRQRLYWTNIGMKPAGLFGDLESIIQQPKDKGILLKDILESEVDDKYFLKQNSFIFDRIKNKHQFIPRIPNDYEKSNCLKIGGKGVDDLVVHTGNTNAVEVRKIITHNIPEIVNVRKYEVNIIKLQECLKKHKKFNNKKISEELNVNKTMVDHWFRIDNYFSIPDKNIWLKLKKLLDIKTDEFDESIMIFEEKINIFDKSNRVYDQNGISPTLTSTSCDEKILINSLIRRLTPIECERLQTVKDNYTAHVSDSQRYKMLGNGWTVDVIAHIFSYLTS